MKGYTTLQIEFYRIFKTTIVSFLCSNGTCAMSAKSYVLKVMYGIWILHSFNMAINILFAIWNNFFLNSVLHFLNSTILMLKVIIRERMCLFVLRQFRYNYFYYVVQEVPRSLCLDLKLFLTATMSKYFNDILYFSK